MPKSCNMGLTDPEYTKSLLRKTCLSLSYPFGSFLSFSNSAWGLNTRVGYWNCLARRLQPGCWNRRQRYHRRLEGKRRLRGNLLTQCRLCSDSGHPRPRYPTYDRAAMEDECADLGWDPRCCWDWAGILADDPHDPNHLLIPSPFGGGQGGGCRPAHWYP